uniref:von Willebrand factor A domain containing 7 n=1 Tax=Oncorhynchus tshawytscha TaxID=74940 RepID=A0AAZ3RLU8_ONCTS
MNKAVNPLCHVCRWLGSQWMTMMMMIMNKLSCWMMMMMLTVSQAGLGRGFWHAVGEVVHSNAAMDFLSSTRSDPVYHFDSERVEESMAMLRQFWAQTLLSARAKEYQGARHSLGQLLHSLQDFYSHSNWVEMGQHSIYLHLLQPGQPAFPVATGTDTPTCMECHSATCRDNLLPRLTQSQQYPLLLTTGYFSTYPPKPQGKCSHGGVLDSSRHQGAKGGINKDSTSPLFSPHHYLHVEAARLATTATLTVLRDLRDSGRLFSVKQPPALVFVMDTTGSMFEEITAARLRAHSIIQARANTPEQPGTFLLVPFHDPGEGEGMTRPGCYVGGGDEPEMCLSAIQLALTHSPPLSEIFVFTDASPKDAHLYNAVRALILEKQCKVTLFVLRRRRRETLSPDRFALYSSLSSVSGGLTVFTTNSDIHRVSAIVEDNTAADKVLQQGKMLTVVPRLSLYYTQYLFPQSNHEQNSSRPTDNRVIPVSKADSNVDFLYYFAVEANGTHPGLAKVEGSPIAGEGSVVFG